MSYVNIHSHNTQPDDIVNVHNFRFGVDQLTFPLPTNFSIGIHPWDAENNINWDDFYQHAQLANAIGECGLDKACNVDFQRQTDVFYKQIDIAQQLKKPLIIHCVQAYGAILDAHKLYNGHLPWLIHGCYGSAQWINDMAADGNVYFSVGPSQFQLKRFPDVLTAIPDDKLLAETDDSSTSISEVYNYINANIEQLYNNYLHFFRTQYLGIKQM